ncbi:MAG: conjugal transfer mating pair stabilization protein TraN [Pseudomonas sp.]|nr:conjugal transfer mating pair stabilization protein TraN [Pseudomonas sp.]
MRARTKHFLKRLAVGTVMALQLNTVAFHAWADSIAASADLGQQTANLASQEFDPAAASLTLQELFPDLSGDSVKSLEDVYGDDSGTISAGIQANTRLEQESSMDGEAYRTLTNSRNQVAPDLSNDPMFNTADKVREEDFMTGFKENFADCKRTDIFESVQGEAHVANYKTCERVVDQGGNVEFTHDYKVGIVEYISGQPNFQSCGPGCLYVWIGDVADNNLGGWCTVYEKYVRYRVINRDAILSAKLDYIQWDDFAEIHLNEQRIWLNPVGFFPDTAADLPPGYSCEYVGNLGGTGTLTGGGVDITDQFKSEQDVQTFKMRVSVGNRGEIYARIKILYDPSKAFIDNGWGPEERLPMFDMIEDGFCTNAQLSCTSMPAVDASGCIDTNGVRICRSDMPPSPHPSIDPLCKKAQVSAECSYYKGSMDCYTDAQGVQQCPSNEGGNLNTCTQYEQNPSCGFISQGCIDGAKGETGSCYAYEEIWDCGYDTSYETIVNTGAQIECPGGARCMGSECFDSSNTKSGDFAYAVAMLQVAQFAEHDLDCGGDGTDINVANDCKVFKGEAMECKKALGGYVDCCEAPESVSIIDYVNLTMNTLKMTSSLEALNRTGNLFAPGYWAAGSEAVMSAGTSVIKGQWGSIVDSATAAFQDTLSGVAQETLMSELQKWLMQQAYDAMVEMGATAAADAVFATGADGAVSGLGSQAAMVVNIIGWVYMVYVIVDLLINIIWECEEKEFELGAKKETRQCHFVGSYCASEALGSCVEKREAYCCFGSVVGRIIQESAREQLGLGWGEVKSPTCEGITPDQMAQMDWSRVDLSEWIGMLNLAGRLPTANTVSLEDVTGSGSGLEISQGDSRLNTLDRNLKRLENFDVDAVKKQAEEEMR